VEDVLLVLGVDREPTGAPEGEQAAQDTLQTLVRLEEEDQLTPVTLLRTSGQGAAALIRFVALQEQKRVVDDTYRQAREAWAIQDQGSRRQQRNLKVIENDLWSETESAEEVTRRYKEASDELERMYPTIPGENEKTAQECKEALEELERVYPETPEDQEEVTRSQCTLL
jgi:predicted RNA-binding protein YlxR (DUF448 family)